MSGEYLRPKKAAELLTTDRATIYRMAKAGSWRRFVSGSDASYQPRVTPIRTEAVEPGEGR